MIDLSKKRSTKEWQNLLNNVKVSDLEFKEKSRLVNEIECRMNGTRNVNSEALRQIEESQADVSDIIGQVIR